MTTDLRKKTPNIGDWDRLDKRRRESDRRHDTIKVRAKETERAMKPRPVAPGERCWRPREILL